MQLQILHSFANIICDFGFVIIASVFGVAVCLIGRWWTGHNKLDSGRVDVGVGGTESGDNGSNTAIRPISVNYHFTRNCNYRCGFCFHTQKNGTVLPIEVAKRGLALLKAEGMEKLNLSGGEPFLQNRGRYVGELVRFTKQDLGLQSVSVVTNGSLVTEDWFISYGEHLDIMAVSCDSFSEDVNREIGRCRAGDNVHVENVWRLQHWCQLYKVAFKINTVVNQFNKDEDMVSTIQQLSPIRWKVFQCLVVEGENHGSQALRNAERFTVSDDDFAAFLARHDRVECLVPENNDQMRHSYLILDEYMRFLDGGTKQASASILDVGVHNAINYSQFDEEMFRQRGGIYKWSKKDQQFEW